MKVEFTGGAGDGQIAKLTLNAGERVRCDHRARIAMTPGVILESSQEGSLHTPTDLDFGAVAAGMGTYAVAPANGGEIWLAPSFSGDLVNMRIHLKGLDVYAGRILTADPGVRLDLLYRGLRDLPGDRMPVCHASGEGAILLAIAGPMLAIDIAEHDHFIIPLQALIACEAGMSVEISLNAFAQTIDSPGTVADFRISGPGRVILSRQQGFPTTDQDRT